MLFIAYGERCFDLLYLKSTKPPLFIHAMVLQSFFSDRSLHHLKTTVPLLVELNCDGVVLQTDPAVWTQAIIEPFHRNQPTAQQLERTNHLLSYLVSIFHTNIDYSWKNDTGRNDRFGTMVVKEISVNWVCTRNVYRFPGGGTIIGNQFLLDWTVCVLVHYKGM